MLLGFILMTALLSVRYNYGNDYRNYFDIFQDTMFYDWDQMLAKSQWVEIGWLILNKLFVPFGFQWLIVFHTIFLFSVFYYLINKYVPCGWRWLAVFFILFNSGIMIIYISMLRQSMAICLFLLAFDSALDRKIIRMALFCTLAYFIHKSSIVIVPFVLFTFFQSGWLISLVTALGVILMMTMTFDDTLASFLFSTMMSSVDFLEGEYENYAEAGSRGSGIGILFDLVVFIPALFDYKKYTDKEKMLFLLFLFNMIVFPLQYVVLMFARIRYYFVVFGFLYLPFALKKCNQKEVKSMVLGLTVFITLWNYYQFFNGGTFSRAYSEFHTCF